MLSLEIHGIRVSVESDSDVLIERLEKDFGHFLRPSAIPGEIHIRACLQEPPWERIPARSRGIRTRNATIHDVGGLRFCAYGREALAVIDFKDRSPIQIYSDDLNRLHEVTYLVTLSRAGKLLDRRGLHRVHAMGVAKEETAILLLAPMGGGKTTLFLELLRDREFQILSDDSPFISGDLEILPCPLRVGLKDETLRLLEGRGELDLSSSYTIDRMRYGRKTLLPIAGLKRDVASRGAFGRIVLLKARRTTGQPTLRQIPSLFVIPSLLSGMVVGIGLPIMREYFLEGGWCDFRDLARIALSRVRTAIRLARKSETYEVFLSASHESNAKLVKSLVTGPVRRPTSKRVTMEETP